jgi:predicted metal-binding membrane protein
VTVRETFGALPIRVGFAAALTAAVVGAWVAMWAWPGDMSSMSDGLLAAMCESMPMSVHAVPFLIMWAVMVAAMMLPGEAATLVSRSSIAFTGGYLAVWSLAGPIALAALHFGVSHPGSWVAPAAAAVFVVAGLYQFSPAKLASSALHRRDEPATLTGGIRRGLACVRSTGPLMAVMLVVGVMNVAWCALITVVVAAEKNLSAGRRAVQIGCGAVLVTIGVVIAAYPAVFPDIALRSM